MVVSEQTAVLQREVSDSVRVEDELALAAAVVAVRRGVTQVARTESELSVVR